MRSLFIMVALCVAVVTGMRGEAAEPAQPRKLVALSFDDGPSVYTSSLLDVLEENNASATFCVVGNRVNQYADTVRRASELGCEIIGHSWSHAWLTRMDSESIRKHLNDTRAVIESVTGRPAPMLYRPPYGATSERLLEVSKEEGYSLIMWSVGTGDFSTRDVKAIYNAVIYNVHDGAIVLCHDLYPETIKAMRKIIPELINRGYELVTVSELMEYEGAALAPGGIYRGE